MQIHSKNSFLYRNKKKLAGFLLLFFLVSQGIRHHINSVTNTDIAYFIQYEILDSVPGSKIISLDFSTDVRQVEFKAPKGLDDFNGFTAQFFIKEISIKSCYFLQSEYTKDVDVIHYRMYDPKELRSLDFSVWKHKCGEYE